MPNPFHGGARLRRAAILMLATLVCVPAAAAAAPSSTGDARAGVPGGTDRLPGDPTGADLGVAVGSLDARIRAERAEAAAAARSLGEARARLEAADTALAAARRGVDALVSGAGMLATPRFFEPRSEAGGRVLPLTIDAAAAERLVAASERVAAEAERRSAAAAAATAQARRAEAARSEAEVAAASRAKLLEEAQRRLAEDLDEATSARDAERQADVKARRDELVAILEAPKRAAARKAKAEAEAKAKAEAQAKADAEAAARASAKAALTAGPIGPPTGGYPAVSCPGGGSITVDGSLAHNLRAMLLTAWRDGVNLCGGGYRDRDQQVRLRAQHCGSSEYAIYQMPSGSCSPPTAIPGTSMHERGLAIDFQCAGQSMSGRSSACFAWMAAHAVEFGLYNLPSEPWHWSVDGS
jgi:LAS superfamily LD-carboxypeptidase LdcB